MAVDTGELLVCPACDEVAVIDGIRCLACGVYLDDPERRRPWRPTARDRFDYACHIAERLLVIVSAIALSWLLFFAVALGARDIFRFLWGLT